MKALLHKISLILLPLALTCTGADALAQEYVPDLGEVMNVSEKISGYIVELSNIASAVDKTTLDDIASLERRLESVNFRCSSYMDTEQLVIVSDERLMGTMTMYKELFTAVSDSLSSQRLKLDAVKDFNESDAYINSQVERYGELSDQAFKLSLTKQTAAKLSKLKAEEQLEFQKIQQAYDKAVAAAGVNSKLSKSKDKLDDVFCDLQLESEKIQAMEFKPFKDRIKDYLMSFAAVSVILMFLSMLKSKIAALKAQKEAAKKYKDLLNDDDYPTI